MPKLLGQRVHCCLSAWTFQLHFPRYLRSWTVVAHKFKLNTSENIMITDYGLVVNRYGER
jgi:hypothetical protein